MLNEGLKAIKFIRQFKKYNESEDEIVKQRALLYIKELLKTQGGILTKFLQYKGTSPEEIETIQQLSQQELEGISLKEISKVLNDNLGEKALDLKNISENAIAASVGQVHFAELDNQKIAIKIQYPNIKETFLNQLKLLNLLPMATKISPMKKWGIDITSYQKELESLIHQECNYLHEAKQLGLWEDYLKSQDHCHVPKVYGHYSNEKVLVQSFVDGVFIEEAKVWSDKEKKDISRTLIKAYFHLFFQHNVIQGDTNHGNFMFNRKKRDVYFIDLGQTVSFSKSFVDAFIYLLNSYYNKSEFYSYDFFVAIGFNPEKLNHIKHKLDLVLAILMEPLIADYSNNLNNWNYKKDLDLLLGDDKWWFRSAGGTEFFLFMKSFMGLKNLLCKLNVNTFFQQIIKNELTQISEKVIPHMDNAVIKDGNNHSSHIKISVIDGEVEKVKMTLPFMAIFELNQYFSDEVQEKIKSQNLNVEEIVKDALADGGKPKEILNLCYDKKKVSIELI